MGASDVAARRYDLPDSASPNRVAHGHHHQRTGSWLADNSTGTIGSAELPSVFVLSASRGRQSRACLDVWLQRYANARSAKQRWAGGVGINILGLSPANTTRVRQAFAG